MEWIELADTTTSQHNPKEYTMGRLLSDSLIAEAVCIIGAKRKGGGDDTEIPRRVLGVGTDRASARRSLDALIRTYDPTYQGVLSRETPAHAVKKRRD